MSKACPIRGGRLLASLALPICSYVKPVNKTASTKPNNAAAILEIHRLSLVIPASLTKIGD
jgi:hypothetical protein